MKHKRDSKFAEHLFKAAAVSDEPINVHKRARWADARPETRAMFYAMAIAARQYISSEIFNGGKNK